MRSIPATRGLGGRLARIGLKNDVTAFGGEGLGVVLFFYTDGHPLIGDGGIGGQKGIARESEGGFVLHEVDGKQTRNLKPWKAHFMDTDREPSGGKAIVGMYGFTLNHIVGSVIGCAVAVRIGRSRNNVMRRIP